MQSPIRNIPQRRVAPTLVFAALLTSAAPVVTAETLSQGERDRSMSYLHATRKQLLDIVTTVSPRQWSFKPAPDQWSLAEIAEHLTVTEESVWRDAQQALAQPPAPEKKAETQGKDERILKAVPDRSRKVQAPETVRPSGRWKSAAALAGDFRTRRDRTIEFVQTTQQDLRSHFAPHPFLGVLDIYQWTLMLAAHTDRHVQQMREVMAAPGYPR